jgi:hypothetical protein
MRQPNFNASSSAPAVDEDAEGDACQPPNEVWDLDVRVVIQIGTESEKTDQARKSEQKENQRAAMTVFADLGFHGANTTRTRLT